MFFLKPIIDALNRINQSLSILVQRAHDIFDQLRANGRKEDRIEEELDIIVKLLTPSPNVNSFAVTVDQPIKQ